MSLNYTELKISISDSGKISKGAADVASTFKSMNPGDYIMIIKPARNWITAEGCRRSYFDKIEVVARHTGYRKQDVHSLFKTERNIGTTKDISIEDWNRVLEKFILWAFNQYDCVV